MSHCQIFVNDRTRKLQWSMLAKAVLIAVSVVLFVYIARREHQVNEIAGCYDCGWNMRQALLLVIGSIFLLFNRVWTAVISLLAALKTMYAIGYVAFFNNVMEVRGFWQILRTSVYWTFELAPERFLELLLAVVIFMAAAHKIAHGFRRRVLAA